MKSFTFNVTQELKAFYEAKVTINASSEKAARNKLKKLSQNKLDELCTEWEQNTDNAEPVGNISVEECVES
jgi:hypothetical protein